MAAVLLDNFFANINPANSYYSYKSELKSIYLCDWENFFNVVIWDNTLLIKLTNYFNNPPKTSYHLYYQDILFNVINENILNRSYTLQECKDNSLNYTINIMLFLILGYFLKISLILFLILKFILINNAMLRVKATYQLSYKFNLLVDLEREFSIIDDVLFFVTAFIFIFCWFFFMYTLFYTYIYKNIIWLVIFLILINILILTLPINLFWDLGISFVVYVKGCSNSTNFFIEFIFDVINIAIVFIRFLIQNIRFVLIFLTLFELFEWVYKKTYLLFFNDLITLQLQLTYINNINNIPVVFITALNFLFLVIYYFYYFLHFLIIFFMQLLIYFLITFLLFFFFYTSTLTTKLESHFLSKLKNNCYL